jgi:anti-sigma B factor antagonist
MSIRTEEYNGVCVLTVEGDLANDDAAALRQLVDARAAEEGATNLVVDLEKCSYIDSAGLEALLAARRQCDQSGGRLSLANLDANCRKVLEITRLARHFESHASLAGAMKN